MGKWTNELCPFGRRTFSASFGPIQAASHAPNANEAIDKLANLAIKTCHKLPAKVIRFAYLSFD